MTATGMSIDQKALFSFVKPIADQMFGLWMFIIDAIGKQRYGSAYKEPALVWGNSFDFKTQGEILIEINEAIKAGLPPFVIHTLIHSFLKTFFFSETKTLKVFELISNTDRLLTESNDSIALKIARGTVDKWEEVLHTSAIVFVQELIQENPAFLTLDLIAQKEALIAKAKAATEAIKSPAPATGGIANLIANA